MWTAWQHTACEDAGHGNARLVKTPGKVFPSSPRAGFASGALSPFPPSCASLARIPSWSPFSHAPLVSRLEHFSAVYFCPPRNDDGWVCDNQQIADPNARTSPLTAARYLTCAAGFEPSLPRLGRAASRSPKSAAATPNIWVPSPPDELNCCTYDMYEYPKLLVLFLRCDWMCVFRTP